MYIFVKEGQEKEKPVQYFRTESISNSVVPKNSHYWGCHTGALSFLEITAAHFKIKYHK